MPRVALPPAQTPLRAPLPSRLLGADVEWVPWQTAPAVDRYDRRCTVCGYDRPPRLTFGTIAGARYPIRHYVATRCPQCFDSTIYRVDAGQQPIWHHRGGTTADGYAGHTPAGIDCDHAAHPTAGVCRPVIVCAGCGADWPCPVGAAYAAGLAAGAQRERTNRP